MSSGVETPVEAPAPQSSTKSKNHQQAQTPPANNEQVYRFYLSPPPVAPMQPPVCSTANTTTSGGGGGVVYPQAMYHQNPPMGLVPYSPYMPMSPPQMAGVSAFGQPAYYAQVPPPQPHFYPSAFGMPPQQQQQQQPRVSTTSTLSSTSGAAAVAVPQSEEDRRDTIAVSPNKHGDNSDEQQQPAKTPIVNGGVPTAPTGGFGTDQDGQYFEIKFPSFGQAQLQDMFMQLQLQQQQKNVAMPAVATEPDTTATNIATKVERNVTASKLDDELPLSNGKAKKVKQQLLAESPKISIYDVESFASTNMEDIVFDTKEYFWKISSWDKLERRATSETFKCGGHIWRILLRPFGSTHKGVLSLFLECLGTADSSEDWQCTCKFVLAIANPHDSTHNTHGSAYHRFHRTNPNWGFTRFMKLAELRSSSAPGVPPFIEDGACTIAAYLHIVKEPSQ